MNSAEVDIKLTDLIIQPVEGRRGRGAKWELSKPGEKVAD